MIFRLRQALVLCGILACSLLSALAQEGGGTAPPAPPGSVAPAPVPGIAPPGATPPATEALPPGTAPPSATLPVPPGMRRIHITADRTQIIEQNLLRLIGHVSMETEGLAIHANEATYDVNADITIANGNVSVRQRGVTYWGSTLELNLRTLEWRFLDWSATLPPAFIGAPVVAPVYVEGKDLNGQPSSVHALHSKVTTCDAPVPHYLVTARTIDIYPGDKLIGRDCDLYVLGHRILHLPWFYLSLRQRRSPIVPEFGENSVEGYYLRLLYQYVLGRNQVGGIRLDLTQKLPVGIGIDDFYTVHNGYGEAFLYERGLESESVVRVDHKQQLTADSTVNLQADIRKNSRFTLQPTTITDLNSTYQRNTAHTRSLLNYTRRLNQGDYFSDSTSANFQHEITTKEGRISYNAQFTSYGQAAGSSSTSTNEELWNHLQATRHLGYADINLKVDERENLNNSSTSFSGVERLPEVYFEAGPSSTWQLMKKIPGTLTVGWGDYEEQPTNVRLNRYLFDWAATPRPLTVGHTTYSFNSDFRQTIYGDKDTTALYYYNASLGAQTNIGSLTNIARYTKQADNGFTPFQMDAVYPAETATDSLQYLAKNKKLNLYLTGGRDMNLNRWQDLTFNGDAQPANKVHTTQSVSYDLNTGTWRDLVSQYTWRNDPSISLNVGTDYDMELKRLRTINTQLSWVVTPLWRLKWLGGYSNDLHQFLYDEFLVTRDLHCWDISMYYSEQQQYFYVYLRLKALNLPLPRFGIGRGGQVLDTSNGLPF